MCGIVAYTGMRPAARVLIDGLKRLEYRGYDSSGIAVCSGSDVQCVKSIGKVKALEDAVRNSVPELLDAAGRLTESPRTSMHIRIVIPKESFISSITASLTITRHCGNVLKNRDASSVPPRTARSSHT